MTDGQRRILYVEDSEEIAFLMCAILKRQDFSVHHVLDGKEAAAFIAEMPRVDLVILDIMMPYLDGFQLISLIREQSGWEGVPILMVSARSREPDIVRALELGANDYVVKPFQPQELVARINRLLQAST